MVNLPENYDELSRAEQAKAHFTRIFTALEYVTNRDGWQSRFANRGRVEDKIPVAIEENNLVITARNELEIPDYKPTAEYWGGGEVSQPAEFNGQNSFKNLRLMTERAENVIVQALYRGRQAFGFYPVSDEIQKKAINKAVDNGLGSIRIFDMMNDPENMRTGIRAWIKRSNEEVKASRPPLKLEVCLSYMSAPNDGSQPAWENSDYAKLALEIANIVKEEDIEYFNSGNFSITDKDYAGQHVDDKMLDMLKAVREKLDENECGHIGINLHSHGSKPELLVKAINQGLVVKVDVCAGDLSKGSSHSNALEVVDEYMKQQGFSKSDYENLATYKQMEVLEKTASLVTKRYLPEKFNEAIATVQDVLNSKLAGGAIAALWSTIKKAFAPEQAKAFFDRVKDRNPFVWQEGGQFNTVTPGATICYNQAIVKCLYDNKGAILPIGQHDQQYKDVVMGRYGRNLGMEKGLGDQGLRKAYLMESCLQLISKKSPNNLAEILQAAGLEDLLKNEKELEEKYKDSFRDKKFKATNASRVCDDLAGSAFLEPILRNADIEKFREAIQNSSLSDELKAELDYFSKPNRFPKPTQTLQQGFEILAIVEKNFKLQIPDEEREELALLMMLTRKELAPDKNAHLIPNLGLSEALESGLIRDVDDFSVGVNLAKHLFGEKGKYGKIEEERGVVLPRELNSRANNVARLELIGNQDYINVARDDLSAEIEKHLKTLLPNNSIKGSPLHDYYSNLIERQIIQRRMANTQLESPFSVSEAIKAGKLFANTTFGNVGSNSRV